MPIACYRTFAFFLFLAANVSVLAQADLPDRSPRASIARDIGYTAIGISYSSPSVGGREIWGSLVPYGKVWRAGANRATTLTLSTAALVNGEPIAAGAYALFLIPRSADSTWTLILNRDTSLWGAYGYDAGQDVLRTELEAKFARTSNEEHLKYDIVPQNIENGYLLLSWEKLRLYVPIKVETMERAVAEIQEAIAAAPTESEWEVYAQAAEFLLWAGTPGPALQYAKKVMQAKPSPKARWRLSRAYAAVGDFSQAIDAAQSLKKGEEGKAFYEAHKVEVDNALRNWQSK
ncbi:DUF2911 domain-containing protein [Phaeodactylibacter luteus]|uniref:DUF2911 domain-containing protein n=1 Tax=Phaeodactylibacter luteus TaxID=1564516 RepID=A0A5C6RWA3_9BACT|nr:DUF2911 domain-containing protein [Phaeodactylibacter luteus]TXB66334.1 DUF2911 domain-containing protein [Phaeodactylibacter luteus]